MCSQDIHDDSNSSWLHPTNQSSVGVPGEEISILLMLLHGDRKWIHVPKNID